MPSLYSLTFSHPPFLPASASSYFHPCYLNCVCKHLALCTQALPSCAPFFSPGPLMQKRIFMQCVCLCSQEFPHWHAIQLPHSCPKWGVSPEGDWEVTWVLRSLFAPCCLSWGAARHSCTGRFASCLQALVKTLSGWEGRMDVGVLVDDIAIWM